MKYSKVQGCVGKCKGVKGIEYEVVRVSTRVEGGHFSMNVL